MDEKLVTVRQFYTVHEAEMAKTALESAGIQAFVADVNMASMLSNAVGGAKVQVNEPDWQRATEFLAAWQPSLPLTEDSEDGDNMTTCLQCGQTMPEDMATCPACGWTYDTADVEA
jgi:uncharacterized paraquat-inducible protein A